ncbi:hypothetical protein D9619_003921 [Psilocybe cf. subviscida]|uniref:Uncharacterized protein n=1 Tax=Psilocybe cf. subviscida TaxID=2480587 RepID=A0A8H5F8Y2_9AGAR|nr:hypothetical protein D9619_003921 [Psilocybe cf. subviscida]
MSSRRASSSTSSHAQYLSEQFIQDSFHSYLKSSLAQAKAERLLDVDVLASAEGDLMITGPALCLYFAALRCTTNPPSVPLPRQSKSTSSSRNDSVPQDLSFANCPPPFVGFLRVWAETVPQIQAMTPERQHDLARAICGLAPTSGAVVGGGTPAYEIRALAADLRAVAIEISQRRSFQDRYAEDLQAVLDASGEGGSAAPGAPRRASFVPPPTYDEAASPTSTPGAVPRRRSHPDGAPSLPKRPAMLTIPGMSNGHAHGGEPTPTSPSSTGSSSSNHSPLPSPTLLAPDSPAILFIRETLYAALADVLEREPSLQRLLSPQNNNAPRDRPRAYFACLAHALLSVARTNVTSSLAPPGSAPSISQSQTQPNPYLPALPSGPSPGGTILPSSISVTGVLGTPLTMSSVPPPLQPLLMELASIGREAQRMDDEDTEVAVHCVENGEDIPAKTRMERVYGILVGGVGTDGMAGEGEDDDHERGAGYGGDPRRTRTKSLQGRAVAFANRVNALALRIAGLPAFRQRQEDVFKVLSGVGVAA